MGLTVGLDFLGQVDLANLIPRVAATVTISGTFCVQGRKGPHPS